MSDAWLALHGWRRCQVCGQQLFVGDDFEEHMETSHRPSSTNNPAGTKGAGLGTAKADGERVVLGQHLDTVAPGAVDGFASGFGPKAKQMDPELWRKRMRMQHLNVKAIGMGAAMPQAEWDELDALARELKEVSKK